MRPALSFFLIISLVSLASLAGCAGNISATATAPAISPEATLPSSPAVETATAIPPTAVPEATLAPEYLALVLPEGANPGVGSRLRAALEELASQQGWLMRELPALNGADISPALKLVVAVAPYNGLAELANGAPQVQFVAVGIAGLPELPNLVSIGPQGWRSDQQAFLAGYIAALTSPDWRGGIITTDAPEGTAQVEAFANGLHYFCGLCKPAHPPYFTYPRWVQIPANGDQPIWSAAVDELVAEGVVTIYVDEAVASPDLLAYLAQSKVQIIGSGQPEGVDSAFWVASVFQDPADVLRSQWQAIRDGQALRSYPISLALASLESGILTPARERLVRQALRDLVDGLINPNLVPE